MPALHGVVRWRLIDLAHWLFEEFRISISKQTLSRELRNMGVRKLSARPRHRAQDEEAAEILKKLPRHRGGSRRTADLRQTDRDLVPDEARIGQKNKITRRWAKRGTRPSAPRDQRTASAYISEPSVLPKEKAPGLSCPPATARPWPCISRKSRLRSRQEHMRSFFSIRQDGMSRRSCWFPATSRSSHCRQSHPS